MSAAEIKTALKTFESLPHTYNNSLYQRQHFKKGSGNALRINCFSHTHSHTHTHTHTQPIVVWPARTASFTSRPETPRDLCV